MLSMVLAACGGVVHLVFVGGGIDVNKLKEKAIEQRVDKCPISTTSDGRRFDG